MLEATRRQQRLFVRYSDNNKIARSTNKIVVIDFDGVMIMRGALERH
jgi:hypothetical protein